MNTGFKGSSFIEYLTIFLFLHYFYAYQALVISLSQRGIDAGKVISFVDVQFLLGNATIPVILYASLGFVGIFAWHFFCKNEEKTLTKLRRNGILFLIMVRKTLRRVIPKVKKVSYSTFELVFVLMLLALFLIAQKTLKDSQTLSLISLLVITPLYIVYNKKRKLILYAFFAFLFFFGVVFMQDAFAINTDNAGSNKITENYMLSFFYHNDTIKSSETYRNEFIGREFIVMQDTTTGIIDYFERSNVSHLHFHRTVVVKEHSKQFSDSSQNSNKDFSMK